MSVGIKRLDGIKYYVHDLERSCRFYAEQLNFTKTWCSSRDDEIRTRERSVQYSAGSINIVISTPLGSGGRAHRFLSMHPEGVGELFFEVEDVDTVFRLMEERGGTPVEEIETAFQNGVGLRQFSITTPFGECRFRFRQHQSISSEAAASNPFGFNFVDHITANFLTMKPALLWLEHVLGFEPFWNIQFHTSDADPGHASGSGLKSVVMWDPSSNIKFACNEPVRPFFENSQIYLFNEEFRGDGIQHIALAVEDMIAAVTGLRQRGIEFMPTPQSYYNQLPGRLAEKGVGVIAEDLELLRTLQILVDGGRRGEYLLQIFLRESAELYGDRKAGPFFYELIQRKGDCGFGGGNFRALFESIEREQENGALQCANPTSQSRDDQ